MRLSMCLGRRLCTVLLALASITIAIAKQNASLAQDSPDLELQLAVVVNGHSIDKIGSFVERGKKLFVTRREWGDLGFKLPPPAEGETVTDDTELAVESLPGISVRLDEKTQTLYVTAATAAMEPTLLSTAGTEETGKVRVTSGWGSVVNYDVTGTHVTATNAAEGSLDGRVFTPYGVASSSLNATSSAGGTPGRVIRLDSTYSYSDPDTLQRTNVGDVVSGGLAWTRPVRLFAGQQTTDFSLRPDLVTTAVPTLAGQVAVPSSIDVLVNGVQLLSKDVQPGPFEIHQLPVVNGVDNVTMVVRDAAGNETIQNLPVYSSSLLLAPDLSNFSAEIGAVRLNYGDVSDDYHALAGIASYRYGLFDWVTIEGHAEAAASTRAFGGYHTPAGGMAGGGAAFKIGSLGAIAIDGAISDFGGRGGGLLYAAVEHTSSTFSISGAVQMASKGFGDVASAYGQPVPRMQIHAGVSVPLGNLGSISISYVGIQRPANTVAQEFPTQTPQTVAGLAVPLLTPANRVALLSATYSRPVFNRKAYFYATGFHDLANVSSFGLTFGLSIPLGRRTSGNVTANSAGKGLSYGSVQVSQSASTVGDFGYQVDESAGSPEQQMAEGDYKTPWNSPGTGPTGPARCVPPPRGRWGTPAVTCSPPTPSTTASPSSTRPEPRTSPYCRRTGRSAVPTAPAACWCRICGRSTTTAWRSTRPTCRSIPRSPAPPRSFVRRTAPAWLSSSRSTKSVVRCWCWWMRRGPRYRWAAVPSWPATAARRPPWSATAARCMRPDCNRMTGSSSPAWAASAARPNSTTSRSTDRCRRSAR